MKCNNNNKCKYQNPPSPGGSCKATHQSCNSDTQCCSNKCRQNKGTCCLPLHNNCYDDDSCCSNKCKNGVCGKKNGKTCQACTFFAWIL